MDRTAATAPPLVTAPDTPWFVVAGLTCLDVLPDGRLIPGGGVMYQSLTARTLGRRVGVVTAYGDDAGAPYHGTGISVIRRPDVTSTRFENRYENGRRNQRATVPPPPLGAADVPAAWLGAPVVSLAPILDDLDPRAFAVGRDTRTCLALQGLLRQRDDDGRVRPRSLARLPALPDHLDVIALSEEDLGGDENALVALRKRCRYLVYTRGARGATVFEQRSGGRGGRVLEIAACPAQEVDATGAGDVFAASLMIALGLGTDVEAAAHFAAVAAAANVEHPELQGITVGLASRVARGLAVPAAVADETASGLKRGPVTASRR